MQIIIKNKRYLPYATKKNNKIILKEIVSNKKGGVKNGTNSGSARLKKHTKKAKR